MLVGFLVIIAFSPQLLTKDPNPGTTADAVAQ